MCFKIELLSSLLYLPFFAINLFTILSFEIAKFKSSSDYFNCIVL